MSNDGTTGDSKIKISSADTASNADAALLALAQSEIHKLVKAGTVNKGDLEAVQHPDGRVLIVDHREKKSDELIEKKMMEKLAATDQFAEVIYSARKMNRAERRRHGHRGKKK